MSSGIQKVRYDSLTQSEQTQFTQCSECQNPFNANDHITKQPLKDDWSHSDCLKKYDSDLPIWLTLGFLASIVFFETYFFRI